jgi:Ni2+-binding GTPase involved in maturation of urease and hydrogenase
MNVVRFAMVGGFLGAGKTTTIARLARYYMGQGLRVGLVTNDQAQDLVDTTSLRAQGFSVQEVPGACFCCKFDELVARTTDLQESERPDLILAEPVGSCTDLVATVVQPLKALYSGRFRVAPYSVLFKPSHGLRILRNEGAGFSAKAAYIFRKQLEEADTIVVNRADELRPRDLQDLRWLLADQFPDTPVLVVSAKTGHGFDAYTGLLNQDGAFGRKLLDIDYDTYAEGEAELGWLNTSAHLSSETPFAIDPVLTAAIDGLRPALASLGGEVAHLKVIGIEQGGAFGVANLVSSATGTELSLPSQASASDLDLILNARVAIDPSALEREVHLVVREVCAELGIQVEFRQSQSLRPGRPTPTHRYATAVP